MKDKKKNMLSDEATSQVSEEVNKHHGHIW
jgi:hypothetical protein